MIQETLEEGLKAHKLGDLVKAESLYKKVLQVDPRNADALNLNGIVYASTGNFKKAELNFKKAISFYPDNVDFRYSLFNLYKDHSQYELAIQVLLNLLVMDSTNLVALKSLGGIYFNLKNYPFSRQYYEKYSTLNPNDSEVLFYLARCNFEENDYKVALKLFKYVLKSNQVNLDCIFMIGLVNYHLADYPETIKYLGLLLQHQPKHIEGLYYKASSHFEIGEGEEAYSTITKLHQIAPDNSSGLYKYLYFSKYFICEYSEQLSKKLNRLLQRESLEEWAEEPSYTIRRIDDPSLSLRSAKAYASKLEAKIKADSSTYTHGDKIHVAYLSSDFNDHPVGVCMEGVLQNHKENEICFSLISLSPCTGTAISKRFQNSNLNFYDFSQLSQKELVKQIRSLNVSILVDLIGYTKNACLEVHIRKAAPIQVWYLGYPASSGSRFVDYIISDRVCVPQESEKYFTEKVINLDGIYHAYTPSTDMFCGPNKPSYKYEFTFGLFTNPSKISNVLIDALGQILNRVPNSILLIGQMNELALRNIRCRLMKLGVKESRLVVSEYSLSRCDYLSKIRSIDLFLDTNIYNAHSTLLDFLFMGVPAISIRGKQFAARVSQSFLTKLSLESLLADTFDDYVGLAVKFGKDRNAYLKLRQDLVDSLKSTKIFDPVTKAQQLEDAYKFMWKKHLES